MYSDEILWNLRTHLPMQFVLEKAKDTLHIPYKEIENYTRFLCPNCREMRATINPKNNLAHCFCCKRNFNNIDVFMSSGFSFKDSADILWEMWNSWLEQKERGQANVETKTWHHSKPISKKGDLL